MGPHRGSLRLGHLPFLTTYVYKAGDVSVLAILVSKNYKHAEWRLGLSIASACRPLHDGCVHVSIRVMTKALS